MNYLDFINSVPSEIRNKVLNCGTRDICFNNMINMPDATKPLLLTNTFYCARVNLIMMLQYDRTLLPVVPESLKVILGDTYGIFQPSCGQEIFNADMPSS